MQSLHSFVSLGIEANYRNDFSFKDRQILGFFGKQKKSSHQILAFFGKQKKSCQWWFHDTVKKLVLLSKI